MVYILGEKALGLKTQLQTGLATSSFQTLSVTRKISTRAFSGSVAAAATGAGKIWEAHFMAGAENTSPARQHNSRDMRLNFFSRPRDAYF